jgi:hypothetical protein
VRIQIVVGHPDYHGAEKKLRKMRVVGKGGATDAALLSTATTLIFLNFFSAP